MNRDLLIFVLVLLAAGLIGGFVGAEWFGSTFSPTGALVAAGLTAAVLLGLGALFEQQEKAKKKAALPPEIRKVFDRMTGRQTAAPPMGQDPATTVAVRNSLERRKSAIDPNKIAQFAMIMRRLGTGGDSPGAEEFSRMKLLLQPDPVLAALSAQQELLNMLLDRSRGDPSLMGQQIASRCFALCELVNEGVVATEIGRRYFYSYVKVFERVHGIKLPFAGGPLDFDTSLEIAREVQRRDGAVRGDA